MNNKFNSLSILSGKGGAGKTVIALSMSKVLAEAGCRVLLVDCDLYTHGASYFFESAMQAHGENLLSLTDLIDKDVPLSSPLFKTDHGFFFLPSITGPIEEFVINRDINNFDNIFNAFKRIEKICLHNNLDVVIFDCQAGYSFVVDAAARFSQRNLIVLEPDAVSSAAMRVLYLQLRQFLKSSNTWQIFNKLTEEERPVYERLFGGTLFTNLPPIPFDWQVRAAFALSQVPSVTSKWSAFGLGVMRVMKVLFPSFSAQIDELEYQTVGKWYEFISGKINALRKQKSDISEVRAQLEKRKRLRSLQFSIGVSFAFSIVTATMYALDIDISAILPSFYSSPEILLTAVGLLISGVLTGIYFQDSWGLRKDQQKETERDSLEEVELELEKYVTLLETDPILATYKREELTKLSS